ncbi:MAG: hypothetical protein H6Q25_274 [Bacteroidetes bacterium]|nr:hypothetical protein [Bacteroidota bacterium]
MTREEQIKFCEKCEFRKFDAKQGIICSLTEKPATFVDRCGFFKEDITVLQNKTESKKTYDINGSKVRLSKEMYEKLKMEQNYGKAIISGLIVGILGAFLWGLITVTTYFQIGYMAIAIGAGVGFTVRKFGNGIQISFGVIGAVISFFSVVLGNFLSQIGFIALQYDVDYWEVFQWVDFPIFNQIMKETFNLIDIIFYAIAISEGYAFAFKKIKN